MRENGLAWVVALGSVIFIHELGHFLVAKLAGIYVKTFSIGFGPKLLKLRLGETQYALSAIPLGGYVRMAGESTEEPSGGREATSAPEAADVGVGLASTAAAAKPAGEAKLYPRDEVQDADIPPHRYLRHKPIPTRLAVVTAGPFANLFLTLVIMTGYFHHEATPYAPTTVVGELAADAEEAKSGLRADDRILQIAGRPVANSLEIERVLDGLPAGSFEIALRRSGRDTTLVLPGVRREGRSIAFPRWTYRLDAHVGNVKKDGPAWKTGLRPGDRIVEIGGEPIEYFDQLHDRITPAIGRELSIRWERQGQLLSGTVVPEAGLAPVGDGTNDVKKVGRIQLETYLPVEPIGYAQAVRTSLRWTWSSTGALFQFLGQLVQGKVSREAVGGPIRIAVEAASALRWGWWMLASMIGYLSLNLFLLNLLPIPVLDGGHVLFMVIEAVRGEALSPRVQDLFLKVGVSALLALMGLIVVLDVVWVLTR